jgi:hypothetical protein
MAEAARSDIRAGTAIRSGAFGLVVAALALSLWGGMALRAPCSRLSWDRGLPWHSFCYTDILVLYQHRGLDRHEVPFLEARNEYPVGTAAVMYATSVPVSDPKGYLALNIVVLAACALATAVLLIGLVGRDALYFAAAPTLLLGSFINWDLFVVLIATVATAAFLRRRDLAAGILLGLGAATKFYPALLVVPFLLQRLGEGERRRAGRLALGAAASWLVVNAPIALAAPGRWAAFFRFNSRRPPEWATPWSAACRALTGEVVCSHVSAINALSLGAFVAGAGAVAWWWRSARVHDRPLRVAAEPWTLGFVAVALFLLTTKVYSPQYSIWLLPWFALVFPDLRWFVAFELADASAFFLRFSFAGRYAGFGGAPLLPLEVSVVVRALVLLAIVVVFLRERTRDDGVSMLKVPAPSLPGSGAG